MLTFSDTHWPIGPLKSKRSETLSWYWGSGAQSPDGHCLVCPSESRDHGKHPMERHALHDATFTLQWRFDMEFENRRYLPIQFI